MAEFGLDDLALQELRVVEDQQIDRAQRLLKAIAVCDCSAATKPYMNFSAVR